MRTAAFITLAACAQAALPLQPVAPRGWNSWYNFLGASNASDTLAAAQYMAQNLLQYGYDTITIDEGWSDDGNGGSLVDQYGRLTWNTAMYPNGLPALAAQLNSMGVKLGLWLIRGIPRTAVQRKLPIYGSSYTADQAATLATNCSWSSLSYGGQGPGAVAYYSSLAQHIASWGVSFVKIDCMWPNKYEGTPQNYFDFDVQAMTQAFTAANLTISLSPGISVSTQNASFVASNRAATMYRIAEDVLDVYDCNADGSFPQCVHQKFAKALEFEPYLGCTSTLGNCTWPDFDMLMVGRTIHSYGSGQLPPTETRLTCDEQITAMTLWSVTGTPLIIGGRLPLEEDANGTFTLALLTNAEVLALHNETSSRFSFVPVESGTIEVYGWAAVPTGESDSMRVYATVFNAEDTAATVSFTWDAVLLPQGIATVCVRDLWAHSWEQPVGGPLPAANGLYGVSLGVPAHGARAVLITPVDDQACQQGIAGGSY